MSKALADLIVLLHLVFIAFVLLGGLLVLKWKIIALLHVPCAMWGVLIELSGWVCPLTPLENHFREAAGDSSYSGDFIDRYVMPLVYPEGLTKEMQVALAVTVVAVNLGVYGFVIVARVKRRRSAEKTPGTNA